MTTQNVPATKEVTTPAGATPRSPKELVSNSAFAMEVARALPSHFNRERFMRVALTTINNTPKLAQCTVTSIAQCLLDCAQLGLEPGGPLGRAYLIPFEKRRDNIVVCTLIIGYKGLVDLAYRSGRVLSLQAGVVHKKDVFEYARGLQEKLHHVPSEDEDPGPWTHVYSIARMEGGAVSWDVMTRREVDAIKKRSKGAYDFNGNAKKDHPWHTDEPEMAKKTMLRRHSKVLPLSAEFHEAIDREDKRAADAGMFTRIQALGALPEETSPEGDGPEVIEAPATATEERLAQLADLLDSKDKKGAARIAYLVGLAKKRGIAIQAADGKTPEMAEMPAALVDAAIEELGR